MYRSGSIAKKVPLLIRLSTSSRIVQPGFTTSGESRYILHVAR